VTRIACQQLAPRLGDLEHNTAMTVTAIRVAVDAGADVVVLPELASSGYMFTSTAEAAEAAIGRDHDLFRSWAEAAGDAVVVGGFCEIGDTPDTVYNSAVVVDRTGPLAFYRKTHLWDAENTVFTPGDDAPPVVETRAGRIGVCICYDLEFCEVTRSLALAGAELIAAPVNWPTVERPAGEHPPEVVIAMAAARTNKVAIACCDRDGIERGQDWTRGTTIIGSDGWVLATAGEGGLVVTDVDLTAARDKRISAHNDLHADRRPTLYQL
jgi:5-aminopentanamidase